MVRLDLGRSTRAWPSIDGRRRPTLPTRTGFSLVELLVVISILILIVALTLPAITRSIEGADRNRCGANQARLAAAMASYDSRNNALPGIRNTLAIKSPAGRGTLWAGPGRVGPLVPGEMPDSQVSWFIMILPHVGLDTIFNQCVDGQLWWGQTGYGGTPSDEDLAQDVTTCPSRADGYQLGYGGFNMNYRANGRGASIATSGTYTFNKNDGAIGDNANGQSVSVQDISAADGTSTTLLISEGTRDRWLPNTWSDNNNMTGKTSAGRFIAVGGGQYPNNAMPPNQRHIHPDPGGNLLFGFTSQASSNPNNPAVTSALRVINIHSNTGEFPCSSDGNIGGGVRGSNAGYQSHTGGVPAAFVDGSWRFLKDDLSPLVYGHLLTHRSVWDGSNYSTNSARANVFLKLVTPPATNPYTVKAEDYY